MLAINDVPGPTIGESSSEGNNTTALTANLIDFGSAAIAPKIFSFDEEANETNTNNKTQQPFALPNGTIDYWPPERFAALKASVEIQISVDMWAIGIVLFIMLAGVHPFDLQADASNHDFEEIMADLLMSTHHDNDNDSSKGEEEAKNCYLTVSPYLDHVSPCGIDLIRKLLEVDPMKRITAAEVLEHPWVVSGDFQRYGGAMAVKRMLQ